MSALNLLKALVQFAIASCVSLFVLPQEYGLIAFSTPIIAFIALLTDMGLSSAIVRHEDLSSAEAGGAFTFSLTVAIVAALALMGLAWPLQTASNLPGLAPLLMALTLAVICTIAAAIPRALLERNLRYQTIATYEAVSLLIAAAASIVTLLLGGRIWAVVVNQVIFQVLRMLLFWQASRKSIDLNFKWGNIKPLLSFGGWILATNVLAFVARNADNLLIGSFLGAAAVGIYGLSYQFMTLPLMIISWPASGVLMATLSARRGARALDISYVVAGVTQATALAAFPMMSFLSFGLSFPVGKLLSPHWHDVIEVIRILAFAGAIQSIAAYNGAVLLSAGWPRLQFLIGVVNTLALVVGFVVSLPYGIIVFAKVYVLTTSIMAVIMVGAMIRYGRVDPLVYARSLVVPLAASAVGLCVVTLLVGQQQASWLQWEAATGCFLASIGLVYFLSRRTIRASIGVLLASRQLNRPSAISPSVAS
jgi:O-antigen/teichoic acid export membrane protein